MFRPRRYDPSRIDKRTPAQRAANDRSWRIFKLRGLYYHAFLLTGERREAMQSLVDNELSALGAEPEGVRRERGRRENEAKLRRWKIIDKMLRGERV